MNTAEKIEPATPIKLDIGCGKNKRGPDWVGVDQYKFDGVDKVLDAGSVPLPFADSSVEEVHSSHFVEHLTQAQRCHIFNEIWRVLKPGGKVSIVVPHWSNARAYGDPTHQWPAISEWFFLYLNKEWRDANAPHTDAANWPQGYNCNFDGGAVPSYNPQHPEIMGRSPEAQNFAVRNYKDICIDLHANLIAKK